MAEQVNFESDAIFSRIGAPRKARAELARRQLGMGSIAEFVRRAIDDACDKAGVPPVVGANEPRLPAAGSRDESIGLRAAEDWFRKREAP